MNKSRTTVETRAIISGAMTSQAEAFATLLASAEAELADARARLAQLGTEYINLKASYEKLLKDYAKATE